MLSTRKQIATYPKFSPGSWNGSGIINYQQINRETDNRELTGFADANYGKWNRLNLQIKVPFYFPLFAHKLFRSLFRSHFESEIKPHRLTLIHILLIEFVGIRLLHFILDHIVLGLFVVDIHWVVAWAAGPLFLASIGWDCLMRYWCGPHCLEIAPRNVKVCSHWLIQILGRSRRGAWTRCAGADRGHPATTRRLVVSSIHDNTPLRGVR